MDGEELSKLYINFGLVINADVDDIKDILEFIESKARIVYMKKSVNKLRIIEEVENE